MSGATVTIKTADGEFSAYQARPGVSGVGPSVVVIQEIFGVNTVMRGVCDALAADGFVAICPDLFWRIEPGLSLTDASEAEWGRAFELYKAFDVDRGVEDIQATIDHLRQAPECSGPDRSGKVGAVGYCLGGLLAYLVAARTTIDASVSYYGVGIQDHLAEAATIKTPLMLHIADKDKYVPLTAQEAIRAASAGRAGVSVHSYPDQDHAFARVGGQHFDSTAAATANARTLAFFREHLK